MEDDGGFLLKIVILLGISFLVSFYWIGDFAVSMLLVGSVGYVINKVYSFIVGENA